MFSGYMSGLDLCGCYLLNNYYVIYIGYIKS